MWLPSKKELHNFRNPLFLILLAVIISSTVATSDQNGTLSSSTTTVRPTTSPSPPPLPRSKPTLTSVPKSSTSTTTPPPKPTTITANITTSSSKPPARTRNRTPSLEEFHVVQEPPNNDLNETDDKPGQRNGTTKPITLVHTAPTKSSIPVVNNVTETTSFVNVTASKTLQRNKNVKQPALLPKRRNNNNSSNIIRRKSNLNLTSTTKRFSNNGTTHNNNKNNSTKLLSTPQSIPKEASEPQVFKTEHAKMCELGDGIIPATCFTCRCTFNGIFNEWTCIKDDLCIWANHNSNLAKREKINKGIMSTTTTKVPTMKKIGNTNKKHSGAAEQCRRGQYYQDECQYCICAMNGLYQCSDLCSRLAYGPQQWNSPGPWAGNNNYYSNEPLLPYNPRWEDHYLSHRSFETPPIPASQWSPPPQPPSSAIQNMNDQIKNNQNNGISSASVVQKPERGKRKQKAKSKA